MSRHVWRLSALVIGALALAVALQAPNGCTHGPHSRSQRRASKPARAQLRPGGRTLRRRGRHRRPDDSPSIVGSDNLPSRYGATGAVTRIALGGRAPPRAAS